MNRNASLQHLRQALTRDAYRQARAELVEMQNAGRQRKLVEAARRQLGRRGNGHGPGDDGDADSDAGPPDTDIELSDG